MLFETKKKIKHFNFPLIIVGSGTDSKVRIRLIIDSFEKSHLIHRRIIISASCASLVEADKKISGKLTGNFVGNGNVGIQLYAETYKGNLKAIFSFHSMTAQAGLHELYCHV